MDDRVVLVTGGAGNLGQAVTRAFLEAGGRVAVPFYKTDPASALDELSQQYGSRLYTFALDLTTERGAEQAVRQVVEWGGGLSAVAHLVGGYSGGVPLAQTPIEIWNRMIELNMTSAFLISRFAIPELLATGGGSFVFVSSRAAFEQRDNCAAYSATKAGLITLSKAIAEEYGPQGIRSNVIVPDTIDTEDNRRAMPDADHGRWISPEAIARVIIFLASNRSSAINGASVPVYGPG
jgi:NAD(P)-dependent dehydrogenase (short-subunit alcohol dehydrogenase family)